MKKKLLALGLVVVMLASLFANVILLGAETTTVGTITAGTVNAVYANSDEVTVDINIAFPNGVVAPHNIVSVALAGYRLSKVELGTVTYAEGSAEGVVTIGEDGENGANYAEGKILLECPVDSKAPTVTNIVLTVTFTDVDDVDTATGTYDIVVNGDDMTNVNQDEIGITATNGSLVVACGEHAWDEGVVNSDATCTEDGTTLYTCTVCHETKTEAITATGHTAGEAVSENVVDAACNAPGSYDSVVYCTVCNAELSRETITVEATGNHTASEPVTENTVDATCSAAGSYDTVVYCSVCNAEISRETVTVDALPHTEEEIPAVSPTCINTGLTAGVKCSVCDTTITAQEVVPATGEHTYVDGTCSVCGAEDPNAEPEVNSYVNEVTVICDVNKQEIKATFYYTAAETKELANYIDSIGGVVTGFGVTLTWDGTDPITSTTGVTGLQAINTTYWNYIKNNGLDLNDIVNSYYTGMNLSQMATTTTRAITFFTYTLNTETIYVYSEEKSQVMMDYLRTQTDDKSVAVVEAYDMMDAAESVETVVDTVLLNSDYGPNFITSYDLKTITAKGTISYTAAQTKALATYINNLGGVITELNLALTWDDSDPTTSDTALVGTQAIPTAYWNAMKNSGIALNNILNGYYTGANFAQFDQDIKFIAYVTYTDAEGASQKLYLGDVQTITFNSLIAEDDSELAVAYKELYTTFVG